MFQFSVAMATSLFGSVCISQNNACAIYCLCGLVGVVSGCGGGEWVWLDDTCNYSNRVCTVLPVLYSPCAHQL